MSKIMELPVVLPKPLPAEVKVEETPEIIDLDESRRSKSIFDREDVVVNQEERFILPGESHGVTFHYRKSRSPSSGRSKPSTSFRKSPSPEKRGRDKTPDYKGSEKSGRSRSPSRYEKYRRRSGTPNSEQGKSRGRPMPPSGFLSRITIRELKLIRVALRRRNITSSHPRGPIEKNLDDPRSLIPIIHLRADESRRSKSIFDREDVVVNQEERFILPGECRRPRANSRCRSSSKDREYHYHKYRKSRSPSRGRSKPSTSSRKSPSPGYYKPSTSRRPSRSPRGSTSPSYERDNRRRFRSPEKRGREKTPDYNGSEKSGRSRSPSRYEKYRRRSRTPNSQGGKSRGSPSRYDKYSRRPSRSPTRYDTYRPPLDKRSRSSRSPHPPIVTFSRSRFDHRRLSRSPGYDKGSHGSDKRRRRSRSRTPKKHRSRSPSRYDKYSRRPSRSSTRHDTYRPPSDPIVTFSRSRFDHRRLSRSPGYDKGYHGSDKRRRRSRSRTPKKHRSSSPRGEREAEFTFYEGIPGSEYWVPGPLRPGFQGMHRFYPPGFYPQGIPGAPNILPTRIPMYPPYYPFRPRLPVYNKPKPKIISQVLTEHEEGTSGDGTKLTASTSVTEQGEWEKVQVSTEHEGTSGDGTKPTASTSVTEQGESEKVQVSTEHEGTSGDGTKPTASTSGRS